jgi:hypothetical protein
VTFDAVALCREQPDPATMLAALLEAGPDLRVDTIEDVQLVQLYRDDGRLMMTTEGARLVQVSGEVRRVLGIDAEVPHPVWWVESRAPGSDPDAADVTLRFTKALVAATGGLAWSNR